MPDTDDKVGEHLAQIRTAVEKELDGLGEIKESADAELLPELERIEREGWAFVINIREIEKKQKKIFRDTVERNTILGRMPNGNGPKPEKIGRIRI